ncbi:MAG: cyclic nucleotide-binding domain-containing protein [Candidatus Hydrogenedentota bacterium]
MKALIEILKATELFAGLSEEEITSLAAISRQAQYPSGQIIFEEGGVGDDLFILPEGRVSIEIKIVQDTVTEQIYQARDNEVFGELALIDGHRRSARTRAMEDLNVVAMGSQELRKLMDANHHMGYVIMGNLARIVSRKLRDTNLSLRNVLMQQKYIFGDLR